MKWASLVYNKLSCLVGLGIRGQFFSCGMLAFPGRFDYKFVSWYVGVVGVTYMYLLRIAELPVGEEEMDGWPVEG